MDVVALAKEPLVHLCTASHHSSSVGKSEAGAAVGHHGSPGPWRVPQFMGALSQEGRAIFFLSLLGQPRSSLWEGNVEASLFLVQMMSCVNHEHNFQHVLSGNRNQRFHQLHKSSFLEKIDKHVDNHWLLLKWDNIIILLPSARKT